MAKPPQHVLSHDFTNVIICQACFSPTHCFSFHLNAHLYADDQVLVGKCEEELKEKLRKWNEYLKDKGLKINEDKIKVMYESFGTGTTQVIGNVKHAVFA